MAHYALNNWEPKLAQAKGFLPQGDGTWRLDLPLDRFNLVCRCVLAGEGLELSVLDPDFNENYLPFEQGTDLALLEDLDQLVEQFKTDLVPENPYYKILSAFAEEKGAQIKHPFKAYPDFIGYYTAQKGKWYALVLEIEARHVDPNLKASVPLVNLKVDPESLEDLLKEEGIYPAYHMNKKHWVSLVLDGQVPLDRFRQLLEDSYFLAEGGGKK